jgi:hypothetical protein
MKKSHFGLLAAGVALFPIAASAATKICVEAESATAVQPALKKVLPGANAAYSGAGYIHIPWDKNETKGQGQATLKVNAAAPGAYYVWARTFWENGCGNSISLSVNGQERILGEDGTYNKWHWVNSGTRVEVKKGLNTIVLKNRETGVKIDQVFFTDDPDYTPTKTRTVTHDGATGASKK